MDVRKSLLTVTHVADIVHSRSTHVPQHPVGVFGNESSLADVSVGKRWIAKGRKRMGHEEGQAGQAEIGVRSSAGVVYRQ